MDDELLESDCAIGKGAHMTAAFFEVNCNRDPAPLDPNAAPTLQAWFSLSKTLAQVGRGLFRRKGRPMKALGQYCNRLQFAHDLELSSWPASFR
jgi:hypothetical protein